MGELECGCHLILELIHLFYFYCNCYYYGFWTTPGRAQAFFFGSVVRDHTWWCLGVQYAMPGIETMYIIWKANILPLYYLWPINAFCWILGKLFQRRRKWAICLLWSPLFCECIFSLFLLPFFLLYFSPCDICEKSEASLAFSSQRVTLRVPMVSVSDIFCQVDTEMRFLGLNLNGSLNESWRLSSYFSVNHGKPLWDWCIGSSTIPKDLKVAMRMEMGK